MADPARHDLGGERPIRQGGRDQDVSLVAWGTASDAQVFDGDTYYPYDTYYSDYYVEYSTIWRKRARTRVCVHPD